MTNDNSSNNLDSTEEKVEKFETSEVSNLENNTTENNETKVEEKQSFLQKFKNALNVRELIFVSILVVFISLFSVVVAAFNIKSGGDFISFGSNSGSKDSIKLGKDILIHSSWIGLVIISLFNLITFLVRPSKKKPHFVKVADIILFVIFNLLGLLAFLVLNEIFIYENFKICGNSIGIFYMNSLIVLTYSYLIYKLFAENKLRDKAIGYEIFRFALVGAVAALFDFAVTSLSRLGLSPLLDDAIVTFLAVTFGFIIGVAINYVLSIFMVYKNTNSNKSKTALGVFIFVLLSAGGLLIGMGIEYILYNDRIPQIKDHIPYIVVFLIRTFIVMVYNYITRKFILFSNKKDKKKVVETSETSEVSTTPEVTEGDENTTT